MKKRNLAVCLSLAALLGTGMVQAVAGHDERNASQQNLSERPDQKSPEPASKQTEGGDGATFDGATLITDDKAVKRINSLKQQRERTRMLGKQP